jgi:hypothetical protein
LGRCGGAGIPDVEKKPEEKDRAPGREVPETPTDPGRVWLAVAVLVVVPSLLYAAIPVVAFLPLTSGWKVGISVGLVVVAETVFVVSAIFLGKEVVSRYRRFLDPRTWFRGT